MSASAGRANNNKVKFFVDEDKKNQSGTVASQTPVPIRNIPPTVPMPVIVGTLKSTQKPILVTSTTVGKQQPIAGTSKSAQKSQPNAGTSKTGQKLQPIAGTSKSFQKSQRTTGTNKTIRNPQPTPATSNKLRLITVPSKAVPNGRLTWPYWFYMPGQPIRKTQPTVKFQKFGPTVLSRKIIQKPQPIDKARKLIPIPKGIPNKTVQKAQPIVKTRKPIPMLQPIVSKNFQKFEMVKPMSPIAYSGKEHITAGDAIEKLNDLLQAQPRNEHWIFPNDDPREKKPNSQPILFRDLAELECRLEKAIAHRQFLSDGVVSNRKAANEHILKATQEFFRKYKAKKADGKNGKMSHNKVVPAKPIRPSTKNSQKRPKTAQKPVKRLVLHGCRPADNNKVFTTKTVEKKDLNHLTSVKIVDRTTHLHVHKFVPELRKYMDKPEGSPFEPKPPKKIHPPNTVKLINWHNRVEEISPKVVSSETVFIIEPPSICAPFWSDEEIPESESAVTISVCEIFPVESRREGPHDETIPQNFQGVLRRPVLGKPRGVRIISHYRRNQRAANLDMGSRDSLLESVQAAQNRFYPNTGPASQQMKVILPPVTGFFPDLLMSTLFCKVEEILAPRNFSAQSSVPELPETPTPEGIDLARRPQFKRLNTDQSDDQEILAPRNFSAQSSVPELSETPTPEGIDLALRPQFKRQNTDQSDDQEILAPRNFSAESSVPEFPETPTPEGIDLARRPQFKRQYTDPSDDEVPGPSSKFYNVVAAPPANENSGVNSGIQLSETSNPELPEEIEVETLSVVSGEFPDAVSFHSVLELSDLESEPTLCPMSKTRGQFEDELQNTLGDNTNSQKPSQEPSLDILTEEFKAYLNERANLDSNVNNATVDYSGPTPYEYLRDMLATGIQERAQSIMPPFSLQLTNYFTPLVKKVLEDEIDKLTQTVKPPSRRLNKYDRYCAKKYPKAPEHVKVPFRNAWELLPREPVYYRSPVLGADGVPNLRQGPTLEIRTGVHAGPIKIETTYEDQIRTKDGVRDKNKPRVILRPGKSPGKIPEYPDYFDQGLESALIMVRKAIKSATPVKPPKVIPRPNMLDLLRRRIFGEDGEPDHELKYRKKGWKPKNNDIALFTSPRNPSKIPTRAATRVENTGPKVVVFVVNGKPMVPDYTYSAYHLNTFLYAPKTNATTPESCEACFHRCTLCYPCGIDGAPDPEPLPRDFCVTLSFPDLADSNIFFSHDILNQSLVVHGFRKESRERSYVNVTRYVEIPDGMDVLDFTIYRTDVGTLIIHDVREERIIQEEIRQEQRIMDMPIQEVLDTYGQEFFFAFFAKYQTNFTVADLLSQYQQNSEPQYYGDDGDEPIDSENPPDY